MSDFAHRFVDACIQSEFVPVSLRMRAMRWFGYPVEADACVWARATFRSRNVSIGRRVFINVGFFFDGCARLVIEDNVRIGQYVRVITGTHEIGPAQQRCTYEVLAHGVRICKGSWIGAAVVILPGVTIAEGCVIGAGAVVTQSTERSGLYIGSPARRVRDLPDDMTPRVGGAQGRLAQRLAQQGDDSVLPCKV